MSPLKILSGAVVCILKRYQRLYYGMLQPLSIKGQATQTGEYLFMPEDVMIPSIYIITQEGEKLLSQRIEVSLDNWPRDSRYPQGSFIQSLDDVEDKGTVFQLEPNFPHQKFSQEVIDCLPQLPWVITEQDLLLRKDFRELAICSIDAPGTKVFDDALHCRKLENGNYELGVHISDVSHFLKRGTAVDREAAMRGASVNLENHMILMLPKMLTTNLCSLKENAERFAFSVIWEMTEGAEILSSSFLKSVIKSKAALTHSEAQLRIDDKSLDDEVTISLRLLDELAKLLKKQRIDNGEKSTMVEEFMLLANISVAKRILQAFPDSAVLKTKPEKFNFEPLIKAGLSKGFKIKVNSREELFESLSAAVLPENPQFNKMLRIIATQCMAQSLYVVSGLVSVSEYFHHGLVVPIYTHFTSPIRRYPDVIVHRLLAVAIGAEDPYPSLLDKNKTQVLCKELNQKLALTDLYQHIFSKGKAVEGHVLFIQENALQVLLPRFSLVSTFYLQSVTSSDGEAIFAYDEEGPTLSAAGITIRQFDPVTIQLHIDKTNVQHQKKSRKLIKNLMLEFNVPPLIEQSSSALEQQSPKQPPLKKQKTTEGDTED
ncbi:Exosome complex exonuclease RRP44 [Araneus ventricosus]|uniref:Exosome complex exonuclease RRP44 n=1 Tax=Araneus ventricosus TaxID=182803 RepID=A0A4Y2JYA7_ARAVE|nr:Exosome complex exonuclease RRP44 [Araneus ventricosus]